MVASLTGFYAFDYIFLILFTALYIIRARWLIFVVNAGLPCLELDPTGGTSTLLAIICMRISLPGAVASRRGGDLVMIVEPFGPCNEQSGQA
jgi:hypothetical protein